MGQSNSSYSDEFYAALAAVAEMGEEVDAETVNRFNFIYFLLKDQVTMQ